mmetsp:Transcript_65036/g.190262  ORF Transcript_65036/g.190262 Transcript_65036/m.190262 type:complete len:228 (+) Transcript_65036:1164-1847(+)
MLRRRWGGLRPPHRQCRRRWPRGRTNSHCDLVPEPWLGQELWWRTGCFRAHAKRHRRRRRGGEVAHGVAGGWHPRLLPRRQGAARGTACLREALCPQHVVLWAARGVRRRGRRPEERELQASRLHAQTLTWSSLRPRAPSKSILWAMATPSPARWSPAQLQAGRRLRTQLLQQRGGDLLKVLPSTHAWSITLVVREISRLGIRVPHRRWALTPCPKQSQSWREPSLC